MPTVKDIHKFIQTIAPEEMAAEWDHVGLLCGRSDREVRRVMIALDPFLSVCEEAKARDCQLLLTHHPAIWKLDTVNNTTLQGNALLYLIENGISALNAHTNLDCAPGGVNDVLARTLGLENIFVIDPAGRNEQGEDYGLLRGGMLPSMPAEAFVQWVKTALGCEGLRYALGKPTISKVAVGGGSCGDSLYRVAELGCDALVTADCKYNTFADAVALGVTLIDAGHFETENPVCAYLAEQVQAAFPDVEVLISQTHHDPVKYL